MVYSCQQKLTLAGMWTMNGGQSGWAALPLTKWGAAGSVIAPGARQAAVVGLVMREMLATIVFGLGAGAVSAYVCGRYVETQLFGVKFDDGLVFGVSVAILLSAALAASLAPAARASRISPVQALRYE